MYLTMDQAAERLQVSKMTIARRIKDGSLKAIRLGTKTVRISEAELQKFVDSKNT